jgi:Domain of unknown function (DUF6089)
MFMKKHLHKVGSKGILLFCLFITSQISFAQTGILNNAEAGITIAPSNFLGDLGGNIGKGSTFLKDNNFNQTRFFVGAHLTAYPADWLGARFAINYGTISGDDGVIVAKGGLEEARKARNLNFKSKVLEASLSAEVYPSVFFEEDPSDVFHKLRPYGLVGVGAFRFNPQTKDANGNYVNLKPLSTEGQGFAEYPDRKPYSLTQLMIPLGVGVKYFVNDNVSLSAEIILRKTFTDYVDDVSTAYIDPDLFDKYFGAGTPKAKQAFTLADRRNPSLGRPADGGDKRGTPQNNDAYYTAGFKLSFRLGDGDNSYRNSTRCPVMRF